MSEFDEDIGSQDFDDIATDSVDFTESDELQSVDESFEFQEEAGSSVSEVSEQTDLDAADIQPGAEDWTDSGDMSDNYGFNAGEYQEEAEPSISELREQAEREAIEAQQEAEEWADNGDANRWCDGSIREGHEDDLYDRSTNQL